MRKFGCPAAFGGSAQSFGNVSRGMHPGTFDGINRGQNTAAFGNASAANQQSHQAGLGSSDRSGGGFSVGGFLSQVGGFVSELIPGKKTEPQVIQQGPDTTTMVIGGAALVVGGILVAKLIK